MSLTRGVESKRFWASLTALVLAMFAVLTGGVASAENNGDMRVTRYAIDYTLGKDGGVDVREDLTINYEDRSHHGFERYLLVAQRVNSDKHRVYPLTGLSVTSPTRAPVGVQKETKDGSELIRVGDKNTRVSGTQRYVLRYHQSSVVNNTGRLAEFYPNVLGTEWRIPIDRVDVSVHGPAAVTMVRCGTGKGATQHPCTATAGETARFSASGAQTLKDGMSIDAGIATSAFTNTAPHFVDGPEPEALGEGGPLSQSARRTVTWAGAAMGVAVPVLAALIMLRRRRRSGQDEYFDGLPPGALPPAGTQPAIKRGPQRQVAVRFEPPREATPALVGTLIDKRADDRDVSATVVDLAVRGYLTMEELDDDDWRLTARPAPAGEALLPYEADLLNALFSGRQEVCLSELSTTFSEHLASAKSGMYREVVERGWFAESPERSRARGLSAIIPLAVLGMIAFVVALALHVSPIVLCAGFVVAGVVVFLMTRGDGVRTAVGTAVNDQARGFELYLKTAEAKQFKFEEAEQIFSRYMPYAVALGLAERWAKVFGEVARAAESQGYSLSMPMWYVPYGGTFGGFSGFSGIESMGSSLSSFTSASSSAFSSTTGSSGGSGFSGGGFSGGGFGGGGGGGW